MTRIHFGSSILRLRSVGWQYSLCVLYVSDTRRHVPNLEFVLSASSLFFLSGIGPSKLVVSNHNPIIVLELSTRKLFLAKKNKWGSLIWGDVSVSWHRHDNLYKQESRRMSRPYLILLGLTPVPFPSHTFFCRTKNKWTIIIWMSTLFFLLVTPLIARHWNSNHRFFAFRNVAEESCENPCEIEDELA